MCPSQRLTASQVFFHTSFFFFHSIFVFFLVSQMNAIFVCLWPVPPLEGFVMNRVLGDHFETLLYKIFVSIDENTTIQELGNLLQIDVQLVKVRTKKKALLHPHSWIDLDWSVFSVSFRTRCLFTVGWGLHLKRPASCKKRGPGGTHHGRLT